MAPRATMPSERGSSELQACLEAFDRGGIAARKLPSGQPDLLQEQSFADLIPSDERFR